MGTQYETITVTVGGANPQTIPVTVPVNTSTGTGSATFTYTGTSGGTDTLTGRGTIAGASYTSNTAEVAWQPTNGQIQIGPVTAYMWNDSNHSDAIKDYPKFNPIDPAVGTVGVSGYVARNNSNGLAILSTNPTNNSGGYGYLNSASGNSLIFDAGGIGNSNNPVWSVLNSAGTTVNTTTPFSVNTDFNMVLLCNLIVPTAGNHVIGVQNKHQVLVGIGGLFGGTSFASAPFLTTTTATQGQTISAYSGYPLLPPYPENDIGYPQPITTNTINFPSAGIYPMEVGWDYWYHSGRTMSIVFDGSTVCPATSVVSPPPASSPTGSLTITPAGGVTNFQFTGNSITLTVNVSGVTYTSKSYCPVLEGTTGNLHLYNSGSTYTFPTYNGQAVNKTAYPSAGFQLSSTDNNSYLGLFTVSYDGTNFLLNYNGNSANTTSTSRAVSTSLVVSADDVAWFNSVTNSFDLFAPSGTVGGISFNFEVDYANKPSVASISPTTIAATGGALTLVISLNKAFSPQQQGAFGTGNTVNCTCSITGAASTGTPTPNVDVNGWLTGWNVPFTAPSSTTNQTLTVNLTVSGLLTYLSGNTFVQNTVTYITGNVGTIAATGSGYIAPTAQSLSVSPTSTAMGTSATLTATAFTAATNDAMTCKFYQQPTGGSTQYLIGTGTQTSSVAYTLSGVAGYLHTFTLTFNPSSFISSGSYLAFTATDTTSGLTCSRTTTAVYTYTPTAVSVIVSPGSTTIAPNGSASFYATVTGTSSTVTWTLSASGGITLSSSGNSCTVNVGSITGGGGSVIATVSGVSGSANFSVL